MTLKMHGSNTMFRLGLLTIAFCLLTAANSDAATLYWNPTTGGSGTWDNVSTLWNTSWASPPTFAWNYDTPTVDNAVFQGGTTGTLAVDSGGITVQNITIGATADTVGNNYTFSGSGTITLGGTSPNVIALTHATDSLLISAPIAGTNLYFNNNYGSGSGSTITGLGNLVLSGNNSGLSGTINVGGYSAGSGYLRITNANALGTATIRTGGQACTAQFQLDGTLAPITIPSANTFVLNGRVLPSGATTYTGSIANYAGNNIINSAITTDTGGSWYIIESDAGSLTINGTFTSGTGGTRYLYLQGAGNGEFTSTGVIGGSTPNMNLFKTGSGMWTLDAANTFTGTATVNAGVLQITNSSALGTGTNTVTINGGTSSGTLALNGAHPPSPCPWPLRCSGRSSSAAVHLENIAGSNSLSGGISLGTGGNQYVIQSDAGTLSLTTITNNTGDTSTNPRYVYLQGAGNGQVTGVIGSGTGTCPVAINKSGAGTWILFAANTYIGATTISGGTLSLGATGSISSSCPTITVGSGAYFDVSGLPAAFTIGAGSTTQSLAGSGTVLGSSTYGIINGGNGVISPGGDGTVGTLTIQNALTLGSSTTSTVKFDLASTNAPASNDLLQVNGDFIHPRRKHLRLQHVKQSIGFGNV